MTRTTHGGPTRYDIAPGEDDAYLTPLPPSPQRKRDANERAVEDLQRAVLSGVRERAALVEKIGELEAKLSRVVM